METGPSARASQQQARMPNPLEMVMERPPTTNPIGFIPAAQANVAEARPFPPLEEGEIDDISDDEAFQFFEDPYGEDQRQQEAFEQGVSILQGLTQEANNAIRKIKTSSF